MPPRSPQLPEDFRDADGYIMEVTSGVPAGKARIGRPAACNETMKSASFTSVQVELELREAAESVLRAGETLTSLNETSVRETIRRRRV